MPIYIRKKNVKIFKLYQIVEMTFSLILALEKKEKKNVIFFSFLVLLTNKYKKKKNENLLPFFVLFAVQTNSCFSF